MTCSIQPFVLDQFLGTSIRLPIDSHLSGYVSFRQTENKYPAGLTRWTYYFGSQRSVSGDEKDLHIICRSLLPYLHNLYTSTTEQLQKLPFALKYCCAWRFYSAKLSHSASGWGHPSHIWLIVENFGLETDARGGGLSSGEISLFSGVYPLDRCAMIKNGGKICQMAVPCLIIKGAPVPETVGSNLKALHIDSAFSLLLLLWSALKCNGYMMTRQDSFKNVQTDLLK